MSRDLAIASNLSLPLDAVTETIAIVAKRRVGKSYLARRLAEQIFHAKQQVVLVDPKGDHWGIRSGADGKSPGLPIVILGGERGDVPLEATGGELVAKLVVEQRVSALLDLSLFRKHEVATFMTAFLENLYRLKARETYRTPMMLILDEADAIAPQQPQKGEERMLGAAEDIVRRGGQRGIGCTLVTQRSAVLNKNVLTQSQILVTLRTVSPQDLKAMRAWIEVHGTPEQERELMASLPSLPRGDAWVWSPGWPTADGIFQRINVLPIGTFDSGATPKAGEKRVEPRNVADVDLDAFRLQMSATIERAKADHPDELRKIIADLRRELKAKPSDNPAGAKAEAVRDARAEWKSRVDAAESSLAETRRRMDRMKRLYAKAVDALQQLAPELAVEVPVIAMPTPSAPARAASAPPARQLRAATPSRESSNGVVPQARQKILNALAFFEGIGVPQADKTQLALIVGVSPTSGGYFNNLGGLRSSGLIDYPRGGVVALTDDGRAIASTGGIPATTAELHDAIRAKLPAAKWRIIETLIRAHPRAVSKDDLAAEIGVSSTSGGYFNNLGSLRSLGLIDYPSPGLVVAKPLLFLEAR